MKSAENYARRFKTQGSTAQAMVNLAGEMVTEMWADLSKAGDPSEAAIFRYWNAMEARWQRFCKLVNKTKDYAKISGFRDYLKENAAQGYARWVEKRAN